MPMRTWSPSLAARLQSLAELGAIVTERAAHAAIRRASAQRY
jgi:hypothetical protein